MRTNEPFITDAAVRRGVYRIFRLALAQADQVNLLMADDLVSRQSLTVRDAKSLGLKGADRYILVEGSDAALARAVELLKGTLPLKGAEPEDALHPGMEDEGLKAIEHEGARPPLIEERRRSGADVLQPTRVRVANPSDRGHPEDISAVR